MFINKVIYLFLFKNFINMDTIQIFENCGRNIQKEHLPQKELKTYLKAEEMWFIMIMLPLELLMTIV